jgi:hypothetical protein
VKSTHAASKHASRIFICYRRQDSEQAASRLAADLRRYFGRKQVFQDFASIDPGADVVETVQRGLDTCAAVLVVIGPQWLSPVDRDGRPIDAPGKWVRYEVAESLKRSGVRVIPVLLDDAKMPSADDVPDDLKRLADRHAFPLTNRHWPEDVEKLVRSLREVPGLNRSLARWAGLGMAVAVSATLGYWGLAVRGEPDPLADKANALLQLVDRQRREVDEAAEKAAGERDLIQKQLKAARSEDDRRAQQVAFFEAQERLAVEQELAALYRKESEGPQGVAALTARLGEANAAAKAGDLPQARAQYTAVIAALTTLQARPAALREQVVTQRDQSVQRLAGKWTLDDCAKAAQFVVNGRSLQIAWPPHGDFEERVLNADQREVVTVVITAGKYQGRLSGYTPAARALTIRSIADGRNETLKRCD